MYIFLALLYLQLMKNILSITNELLVGLQWWDQDIVNVKALTRVAKQWLQTMGSDGWTSLYKNASLSCENNNIVV